MADNLDIAGMWPIKEYIQRYWDSIAAHIAFRPIYEMYMEAEKIPGSSLFMMWWDQAVGRKVE